MTQDLMKLVDAYAAAASMTLADPCLTRADADRKARAAVVEAIEAREVQVAALTKDAERYRLIRSIDSADIGVCTGFGYTYDDIIVGEKLDVYCDAAIAAQKGEQVAIQTIDYGKQCRDAALEEAAMAAENGFKYALDGYQIADEIRKLK